MWLACSLMWHYASAYGIKAKGSSGLPFTSKVQSKSDRLLLFSETETSDPGASVSLASISLSIFQFLQTIMF